MAAIEYNNPIIKYGDFNVIESFNLKVEDGEIITLFGPSGCGKSTLMKGLLNLVVPENLNSILIDNTPANQYSKPISYTPQSNELLPWLTVRENIELWANDSNNDDIEIVDKVITLLDLKDAQNKLPKELSGGMARRTALARCLATKSSIMCLDEVLVGIQRSFRRSLMVNLRAFLKKNQITTIIISHDHEEASFMSDRIVVLSPSPTTITKPPIVVSDYLDNSRDVQVFLDPKFEIVNQQIVS